MITKVWCPKSEISKCVLRPPQLVKTSFSNTLVKRVGNSSAWVQLLNITVLDGSRGGGGSWDTRTWVGWKWVQPQVWDGRKSRHYLDSIFLKCVCGLPVCFPLSFVGPFWRLHFLLTTGQLRPGMISLRALSKHGNTDRTYFCIALLTLNLLLWEGKIVTSLVCSGFQSMLDNWTFLS